MRELILINAGIIVLATVYLLTFRKGSFYQANRLSILTGVLIALIIPWMHFGETTMGLPSIELPTFIGIVGDGTAELSAFPWMRVLFWIWLIGTAFVLVRLLFSLTRIFMLVSKHKSQRKKGYRLVEVPSAIPVFSFFKWIFWNDPHMEEADAQHILSHEKVHAKQWHSADVLFMQLLCAVFWFNPVIWWLAREVKAVHEFIADEAVVRKQVDRKAYSHLLIGRAFGGYSISIASPFFNQSFLKQRVMKLNQKPSNPIKRWKYTLLLPILGIFVAAAACTKEAENKAVPIEAAEVTERVNNGEIFKDVDVQPEFPGGQEAMMTYMMENLKYPDLNVEPTKEKYFIQFVVDPTGKVSQVECTRDDLSIFSAEGIRVVEAMPNWTPGQKDGKNVNVQMTLPIKFVQPE